MRGGQPNARDGKREGRSGKGEASSKREKGARRGRNKEWEREAACKGAQLIAKTDGEMKRPSVARLLLAQCVSVCVCVG